MRIADPAVNALRAERDIYSELLPLAGARVLELGCGKAEHTRVIAETGRVESILALEVDAVQHAENLRQPAPSNVSFAAGGAEAIPAPDRHFDIVMMFKSLHHVPVALMDQALGEIHRVLKPGGLAYFSEPVFAGDFNAILRLFHDEEAVRAAAFAALQRAVGNGLFELADERFFDVTNHFDSFAHFEERILKVTHTQHVLSPEVYREVRERFLAHMTPQGVDFRMPMRVDLLRRAD
jgi:SAM-dependent methyltransferase